MSRLFISQNAYKKLETVKFYYYGPYLNEEGAYLEGSTIGIFELRFDKDITLSSSNNYFSISFTMNYKYSSSGTQYSKEVSTTLTHEDVTVYSEIGNLVNDFVFNIDTQAPLGRLYSISFENIQVKVIDSNVAYNTIVSNDYLYVNIVSVVAAYMDAARTFRGYCYAQITDSSSTEVLTAKRLSLVADLYPNTSTSSSTMIYRNKLNNQAAIYPNCLFTSAVVPDSSWKLSFEWEITNKEQVGSTPTDTMLFFGTNSDLTLPEHGYSDEYRDEYGGHLDSTVPGPWLLYTTDLVIA